MFEFNVNFKLSSISEAFGAAASAVGGAANALGRGVKWIAGYSDSSYFGQVKDYFFPKETYFQWAKRGLGNLLSANTGIKVFDYDVNVATALGIGTAAYVGVKFLQNRAARAGAPADEPAQDQPARFRLAPIIPQRTDDVKEDPRPDDSPEEPDSPGTDTLRQLLATMNSQQKKSKKTRPGDALFFDLMSVYTEPKLRRQRNGNE